MTTLLRILSAVLVAFFLTSGPGHAAAGAAGGGGALPAEAAAWLAQSGAWSATAGIDGVVGYKDNLLLSATGREESAFARGGVDLLVMRAPGRRVEQSFFFQSEVTRYGSRRTVDQEATAWLQADTGLRAGEAWHVSLPVTGYYYDQVFDVSDTDVERLVAEMKLTGGMLGPTVRWSPVSAFWIEAQGIADRKRYDDGVYDSKTGEAAVRFGWSPVARVETRLAGTRRWRDFDSRLQYSAAGRPLADTHLRVEEMEGEFRVSLKWGRNGQWQSTARTGLLSYRDNGSGYFNHRERRADLDLEWRGEAWLVRWAGAARRVDFEVRTVGLGINPPARLKDEYELSARVEHKLTPRWTLLGGFKWERARSNDPVSAYRVNEGLLGARWNWER